MFSQDSSENLLVCGVLSLSHHTTHYTSKMVKSIKIQYFLVKCTLKMTHRTQFGGDELQEKAEDVQTETAYRNAALYSGRDLIQHGKQDVLGVLTFSESLEMN